MRLTDTPQKIKDFLVSSGDLPKDIFVFLSILLVATGAFLVGRMSREEEARKGELKIIAPQELTSGIANAFDAPPIKTQKGTNLPEGGNVEQLPRSPAPSPISGAVSGAYVGSINGSVYHLPSCPGAKHIKDENKIWFTTKTEAEAAGYKPAGNCKGI